MKCNVLRFLMLAALATTIAVTASSAGARWPWGPHWRDDGPEFDLATAPKIPPGLNERYALFVAPSQKVKATLSLSIHAPKMKARAWMLFAGHPPELTGQHVESVLMTPDGAKTEEDGREHRPLLRCRVEVAEEAGQSDVQCQVETQAQLNSRHLLPRWRMSEFTPPPDLSDAERAAALRPTMRNNYRSDRFQQWAREFDLVRQEGEGEIKFARRVFWAIMDNFTYEWVPEMDRTASHICMDGKSDCGGLTAIFISTLRWQGVPARQLVGRWASSIVPGEIVGDFSYEKEHVKAEFFAQGVGWVPVDISAGVEQPEYKMKRFAFGHDGGDFLVMHIDCGLLVNAMEMGRHRIEWMQGIASWATGKGDFTDAEYKVDWQVARIDKH